MIVFPLPPFTVFSKFVKLKSAVPFPLSHSWELAVFAVGAFPTVNITATGDEVQVPVSYTHLRAHETLRYLVCRLLLERGAPIP